VETVNRRPLTSVCETWTHPLGWELQLLIDGHALQMSSVIRSVGTVRSAGAMIQTIEEWRCAMLEKGWSDVPDRIAEPALSSGGE
jgi:hypothetical protein